MLRPLDRRASACLRSAAANPANRSGLNKAEINRTQEFVVRWRSEADQGFREIVRQQWNFSPPQTTREIEDYQVDLASVKVLELVIVPDIGGGNTYASLENLQLA